MNQRNHGNQSNIEGRMVLKMWHSKQIRKDLIETLSKCTGLHIYQNKMFNVELLRWSLSCVNVIKQAIISFSYEGAVVVTVETLSSSKMNSLQISGSVY